MMKRILMILGLTATAVMAQTSATTPTSKQAAKPASQAVSDRSSTAAKPAAKPAKKKTSTATARAAKKRMKIARAAAKPKNTAVAIRPGAAPKPSAVREREQVAKSVGRRDPFISPIRMQEDRMKGTSICTTGVRCLIINQVVLKGIVKTPEGMIAMVENSANRSYNLREKDQVFNGTVAKITGDSLTFRETVTDNLGHQTTKEVVKKVTAPVI